MKNNKLILLLLFFVLFQFVSAQNFKGGLIAGIAATQVDGDKLSGYNHPGAKLGFFTQLPLNSKIDLRFEMYYIQKGSRKNSSQANPTTYIQRLNYIEVPVLFQYNAFEKLSFFGGPSFAYLFKSSERDQNGLIPANGRELYEKFDFSIHGGGIWKLNQKWSFGLSGSYSMLFIRNLPRFSNMAYHDRRQYNNVVLISTYYTL